MWRATPVQGWLRRRPRRSIKLGPPPAAEDVFICLGARCALRCRLSGVESFRSCANAASPGTSVALRFISLAAQTFPEEDWAFGGWEGISRQEPRRQS